ncbi:hypothetical protein CYFUS_001504 [Cystobacter fuscus]|uniref:Type IV pilus assembly protein PilX n=1 Tax=Cystobacter fuscus TaxID=43 RepID=A0A250IXU0_9BACT|nr:hypothetical protein [Cystobacter fuscus]ATB36090.1 hypothetical protein CYFUS_001504 [Cystobacter fuscus]
MKRRLGRRGSVLLLVVVLLAVLSLLAAAALSFSRSELGAVKNERSGDELLACADAGRQYMLSRFDMLGGSPLDLSPVNLNLNADLSSAAANCPPLGSGIPADARCMRSGHFGQKMSVTGVTAVASNAGGSRRQLRDLSNSVAPNTLGGVPHKITVHCLDENGRGTEVEFVVRFGL